MKYIFCEKRNVTMKEWLGKACDLIDNDQFLGVFRNRQINYEKEFNQSVRMVKSMKKAGKIKDASHYFAKIWKKENITKTSQFDKTIKTVSKTVVCCVLVKLLYNII